jgi:hypothetical protein
MFGFLFGVAFGAAGYWAWQSFGRDLLGMGDQGESTYGSFITGSSSPSSTFSPSSSTNSGTSSTDATSASSTSGSSGTSQSGGE